MAATTVVPEVSSPSFEVPQDPKAYSDWRMTGKLPDPPAEKQPKTEEAAPSKESSDAGDKPAEGHQASDKAPDPETGKNTQERKPKGAEARLSELLDDLRKAGLTPAELKTFKREAKAEAKAEPQKAAPEHTDKPAAKLEPPKKPKPEDFEGKSWEEYEAARDKYYEDLADYKAALRVEEFRTQTAQQAAQRELQGKLSDAEKRYGAEARGTIGTTANAIFSDQQIPETVKQIVNDSPVLVDLLYVAGSNPEDFEAFLEDARANPSAAIRKIVLLERLVSEELAKGAKPAASDKETPARGEDGKFTKPTPEKKATEAPPPPKEVSGRGAAPADEVERAASAGDFRAFRSARNRQEIAARQGK